MSPFFANYSFHLWFLIKSRPTSYALPIAEEFMFYFHDIHDRLVQNIKHMQDLQAKYYDAKYKHSNMAIWYD